MIEYRIKEYDGKFIIERKQIITKTFIYYPWTFFVFWIHYEKIEVVDEQWWTCDVEGNQIGRNFPPCEKFNTLKGARKRISIWIKGPTYHEVK